MNDSLLELLQISYEKNFQVNVEISDDKTNNIDLDTEKKQIEVHIGDPEDKNLPGLFENILSKLK